MRFRANASVIVLALLLAGCASPPRQDSSQNVTWSELNSVVSVSPIFPIGGPVETGPAMPAKPPVTNAPITQATPTWVPLQPWSRANGVGAPVRVGGMLVPAYALQSTKGVFVLHTGSQIAQFDGVEVRLGFAPLSIDGQPYVHTLDLAKTIQPLLQGEPVSAQSSNLVIVIDPGHGGENAGTKSVLGNRYEKEFTLDWALRLQALLTANRCKVFLTRSNDTDLALSNRVAFAAHHKAEVFLSLHFNSAAPNEVEAGLETYCLTPAGVPSSLTRGFADELHQSFPNNAFDTQNLWLALRIHRAILQVNGHRDRGVRRARFLGVLRGQQQPAILVEAGYLSNPQEARQIEDPAYRQKLAEAVAKALLPNVNATTLAMQTSHSGEPERSVAAAPVSEASTNVQPRMTEASSEAETKGESAEPVGKAGQ